MTRQTKLHLYRRAFNELFDANGDNEAAVLASRIKVNRDGVPNTLDVDDIDFDDYCVTLGYINAEGWLDVVMLKQNEEHEFDWFKISVSEFHPVKRSVRLTLVSTPEVQFHRADIINDKPKV